MGLAERIFRRNKQRAEPAEEAPVATQYIIRDSRGNNLDIGQFIGKAAQALQASTGDEHLRTLREMIRNPEAAALVTGGDMKDIARAGSVLLYQATGGQIVTGALREMAQEQQTSQAETLRRQEKALRYRGVRGRIRKTFDALDPFMEPDGW